MKEVCNGLRCKHIGDLQILWVQEKNMFQLIDLIRKENMTEKIRKHNFKLVVKESKSLHTYR